MGEVILDYPDGSNVITRVFKSRRGRQKREAERGEDRKKDQRCCVRTQPTVAGSEGGRSDHEPRNVGCLWKLEKARKWNLPGASRKEHSPERPMLDF